MTIVGSCFSLSVIFVIVSSFKLKLLKSIFDLMYSQPMSYFGLGELSPHKCNTIDVFVRLIFAISETDVLHL